MSLLSWERGLKYISIIKRQLNSIVAPLVGAWIEICTECAGYEAGKVAPLVGAWIEITLSLNSPLIVASLLSWERGLKYHNPTHIRVRHIVAPLVGAWIEIISTNNTFLSGNSRSSRGSVD